MKVRHRLLALIMSVMMIVTYMPALAFADAEEGTDTPAVTEEAQADGPETQVEPVEVATSKSAPVKIKTSASLGDSDDLLMEYLKREVSAEVKAPNSNGKKVANARSRYNMLNTDAEYRLYKQLEVLIGQVANSDLNNAVFSIPLTSIYDQLSFTKEELGVESTLELTENGYIIPDAVVEAMESNLVCDVERVFNALLADMPYELYWFDKELDEACRFNYKSTYFADGDSIWLDDENGDEDQEPILQVSFYVSADYSATGRKETYDLNTDKTAAAAAFIENTVKIISDNAGNDDLYKLYSYRDAVCNAVDYNDAAAEPSWTKGYGDPWQLIYVFDGDDSTKVVCEGYSKAFQFLCDRTYFNNPSIEAYSVTGKMAGGTGAGDHMWNILRMDDGRSYIADVTNSDEGTVGENGGLFLSPALKGSCVEGYGYDVDDNGSVDVTYAYDDDTLSLFYEDELTMSTETYSGSEGYDDPGYGDESIFFWASDLNFFTDIYDYNYAHRNDAGFEPYVVSNILYLEYLNADDWTEKYDLSIKAGHYTEDENGGHWEGEMLREEGLSGGDYTVETDGDGNKIITLTESYLKKVEKDVESYDSVRIEASLYRKGADISTDEPLTSCETWFYINDTEFERSVYTDEELLPFEGTAVSRWHWVYLRNTEYPAGKYKYYEVTRVEVTDGWEYLIPDEVEKINGKYYLKKTEDEDYNAAEDEYDRGPEASWYYSIRSKEEVDAVQKETGDKTPVVKLKCYYKDHDYKEGDAEKTYEFNVRVVNRRFSAELDAEGGCENGGPGAVFRLKGNAWMEYFTEDGAEWGTDEGFTFDFEITEGGEFATITHAKGSPEATLTFRDIDMPEDEPEEVITVKVKAYRDGSAEPVATAEKTFMLKRSYAEMFVSFDGGKTWGTDTEIHMKTGAEQDLMLQLREYDAKASGTDVKQDSYGKYRLISTTFRWDIESDRVSVTPLGNDTFRLKKLNDNGALVDILADYGGEEIDCRIWVYPISAEEDDWNEPTYVWSADYSEVTASRSSRNDASVSEQETVSTTAQVTKAAACGVKGETTYTSAAFENTAFEVQKKTVENIAALSHSIKKVEAAAATYDTPATSEYYECSRCHQKFSDAAGTKPIDKPEETGPSLREQAEKDAAEARSSLSTTTADAKKAEKDKYTEDSYQALQDAISEAEALVKNDKATAEQLKEAAEKVAAAKAALKEKTVEPEPQPVIDPAEEMGEDGTAYGKGASEKAADKAITELKSDNDPKGTTFAPLKLKSTKQAATSITLTWTKVKGASKYVIYGNRCGSKTKLVRIKEAKGSAKSYTVKKINGKKLKKSTYHKFIVVAVDSSGNVVSTSKIIHVATKSKKVGNPTKIKTKAKKNKAKVKKGKTFKLGAKQTGKKVKKHIKTTLRYESSNPKIAKVSSKGVIKGVKKGKCKVYVYAQNGLCVTIKVTVK